MDGRAVEKSTTIPHMSKKQWGMGGVYLRGRTWWIYYPVGGSSRYESSKGTDERKAIKLLKQRLQENGSAKVSGTTYVGELLDLVLNDYRLNGKSIEWCEMVVEKHLRPFFQYMRSDAVGSDQLSKYIKSRKSIGRKNGTVNRELAILHRAFRLGADSRPPKCERLKISKLTEDNVRTGFFEREEFQKFRDALPSEIKPIITFAYYTGCRRGEILGLRWNQVDLAGGMVRLEPGETKNKKSRMIPLHKEVHAMLLEMKQRRDDNYPSTQSVFVRGAGNPIKEFKGAWDAAKEATGIDRLFHDLRRSGVRNLVRAGVPEKVAMEISGHKTRSVFDRYNIVNETDIRAAMRKVEEGSK